MVGLFWGMHSNGKILGVKDARQRKRLPDQQRSSSVNPGAMN